MSDDKERRLSGGISSKHTQYPSQTPGKTIEEKQESQALSLDQEDTVDDLENRFIEEGEEPDITQLADAWHAGSDSVLSNRRLGQSSPIDDMDITADFPTSPNPFNATTNQALIDIGKSPHTTANTLQWLANNANPDVRKAAAGNVHTSSEVLRKLSKDWDGSVRLAVLDNPKVPIDIVTELSSDPNPLVSLRACYAIDERRKGAEGNATRAPAPSTTIKDLPNLHAYHRYMLATAGKANPALSSRDTKEAIDFLTIVAEKISTPTQRLIELSHHSAAEVRAAVARNSNAPLEVLWRLTLDLDPLVKAALTQNESCPLELLRELLRDSDVTVRTLARHEITKYGGPIGEMG